MKRGKPMSLREEIVQQAMTLPPADRVFVADALEKSLASGGFSTPETAAAWAVEIERRIEAYDRGELPASDMETALQNIRQHLANHRARKVTP
jgi:putative addiction module component (TIGR02574 family)